MNRSVSEYPRILVKEVPNRDHGLTKVRKWIAVEEMSEVEVGHAFLCMPQNVPDHEGLGLLIFGDISVEAHDSTMIETAFVQKAREELPGQNFLVQHKGEIPKEFGPSKRHDDTFCVLTASPSVAS